MSDQKQIYKLHTLLNHYAIIKFLGSGQFGQIFLALDSKSNEKVAIKVQPKKKLQGKLMELYRSEVRILQQVHNENVVRYIDHFEQNQMCHLVMEYCEGGDLDQFVQKRPGQRLPEPEAFMFMLQIMNGFQGLHKIKAIHREYINHSFAFYSTA